VFAIGVPLSRYGGWDEKVGESAKAVPADLPVANVSHDHRIGEIAHRLVRLDDGHLRPES
jgi:hypothetical protein